MKFGHLLKSFEADAALPDTVCLNYKKLKKLIKFQTKNQQNSAAAPANSPAYAAAEEAAVAAERAAPAAEGASSGAAAVGSSAAQASVNSVAATGVAVAGSPAADPLAGAAGGAAAASSAADGAALDRDGSGGIAEEDREFVATLNTDLSRVNSYFMEKEEEAVIRLRALEDRLVAARRGMAAPELEHLRNELVDFHGELVLMLHWSLVNYAAVAKILKKHDKMTGSRLRAAVLASVLHQPFLSTESISQLVKEAERHVQELSQLCGTATSAGQSMDGDSGGEARARAPEAAMEGSHVAIYKRTRAALHMVKEMQETASTPSTLLPPSTANSDAAPDGKKQRTGRLQHGGQEHKGQQQAEMSLSLDSVP